MGHYTIGRLIAASILVLGSNIATANTFTPGAPCNNCTIEIFDHAGIGQTSKNAVYRINNPQTPNGTPPFLELYNPTLATIQNCAAMVASAQGSTPFSVQLKAREYTLSGSNQVVFLVEKCRKVTGRAPRPDMNSVMQKKPNNAGRPDMGQRPGISQRPSMSRGPSIENAPNLGRGIPSSGGNRACGSGIPAPSTSCAVAGGGWQTVSNVLSEGSCNLSYDDAVKPGRQRVIYDNDYSVTCAGGSHQPTVYVGNTPSQSNWGAYVNNASTCQMKTGTLPSGARGVLTIVCP